MADPTTTGKEELVRCDSCLTNVIPSTVEHAVIDHIPVVMCRDARACRRRAQAAGRWRVNP